MENLMTTPACIYHVDLNFVSIRPDYIRHWLRQLKEMGYTAILWEIEDKVQWEACPEAVWSEAMSKAEFKAILDEAAGLGLEAIPLLQTIGHGEYILKHQIYSHMRELPEHHDCYCTESPVVRNFLKQLVGEYLDLFGSIRSFHLGGDEAYVFGQCPVCSEKAKKIGVNKLYAEHIMDIAAPILERGAKAGIWGDMILNHPEQMDAIPKELEIWDWNYWDVDGPLEGVRVWGKGWIQRKDLTDELLEEFPEILGNDDKLRGFHTAGYLKSLGYDVFLCSAVRSSGDSVFLPKTSLHARNIAGAARKTAEAGLLGTCVTDWAIRLNSWETHRHMLPVASAIIADPSLDVDAVLEEIAKDLFGCDSKRFLKAIDMISGVTFPFSQAHTTAIQWNGLKDSLPAPPNHVNNLLKEWEKDGRLAKEIESIDATIALISDGVAELNIFIAEAKRNLDLLQFWSRAAWFQLWQARMAKEILNSNRTAENVKTLQLLKSHYEQLLTFDHTPASAAQNAGLVYDCLIKCME